MKTTIKLLSTALASLILALPASALSTEEAAALAVRHHKALEANRKVLSKFSPNYRIEMWEGDQLQWIDLVNVKIGSDGMPIITQINRDQVVESKRGIIGSGSQQRDFDKKDAIVGYALKWILYYNRLPVDRLHTLFAKASADKAIVSAGDSTNIIGVSATNVRDSNANDSVSLWVNKVNGHPIRFAYTIPVEKTVEGYGGAAIDTVINYRYLDDGSAFYPDHIDVVIPTKKLYIKFENLNVLKKN